MNCKIKACKETHQRHYCSLCEAKDSDHFSSHCPEGTTLYHGTCANTVAAITNNGFRESPYGNLGPGVYFVNEQLLAEKIGKRKGVRNAVFKCNVNLGKLIDIGKFRGSSNWQQIGYDSATRMHEPWVDCDIQHSFPEYCLKESKTSKLVVTSIFIEGKQITKDENKTWGDAKLLIQNLKLKASDEEIIRTVDKIKQIPDVGQTKQIPDVGRNMKVKPFYVHGRKLRNGKKHRRKRLFRLKFRHRNFHIVTFLLKHWYLVIKTLLILFHTCNGIWSILHLFSEYNSLERKVGLGKVKAALISYACFFSILSVTRIGVLVFHYVRQVDDMEGVVILESLTAFILEMPMMVSQAFALKEIPGIVWSKFTWDVAMQLQFHFNLYLFLTIDMLIIANEKRKVVYCLCIPIIFILSTGLCAAPIHWTIFGWKLIPQLSDFGGSLGNGKNIINLLNILMYVGCVGVWFWTIFLSVIALVIALVIFGFLVKGCASET